MKRNFRVSWLWLLQPTNLNEREKSEIDLFLLGMSNPPSEILTRPIRQTKPLVAPENMGICIGAHIEWIIQWKPIRKAYKNYSIITNSLFPFQVHMNSLIHKSLG